MKKFKFVINGNTYHAEVDGFDGNKANIEVNGTPYEVEVLQEIRESKTPTLVRSKIKGPDKPSIDKAEVGMNVPIKAPLPGNIIKVLVEKGDIVKKGDILLLMESMKMENTVLAEKDGVVENILVEAGQPVLQGDVLIELV